MKKFKFVFIIPIIIILLIISAYAIADTLELSFRNIPDEIFSCLVAACIICIAVGIIILLRRWRQKRKKALVSFISILSNLIISLSCVAFVGLCFFGFAFAYQPEHVVIKNGIKTVACVNSFTDVSVYYYEYKNPIFRGKEKIGGEWYGSGGYDPFTVEFKAEPKSGWFKNDKDISE